MRVERAHGYSAYGYKPSVDDIRAGICPGATRVYDCDLLDCLTHSSYSAYYGFINTFEWME